VKQLKQRLIHWVEHRTGLESAIKNFFMKRYPIQRLASGIGRGRFFPRPGFKASAGLQLCRHWRGYNSLKYTISELDRWR
jgi:hypothetical protein